jgi:hypothetical protein
MLTVIATVALVLCVLNWLLFVALEAPTIREALRPHRLNAVTATHPGIGSHALVADLDKLAGTTGHLATDFKKAGPAFSAAALSVLFLFVALIAAAAGKF